LLHAIEQFEKQTWPNRELVVVHQGGPIPVEAFRALRRVNARIVLAPTSETLGALRNRSFEHASGEWCLQWDDDDVYHPRRIAAQMQQAALEGVDACFLSRWLIYDTASAGLYESGRGVWEGSMLVRRNVWPGVAYVDELARGEDALFVHELMNQRRVCVLDEPWLYTYRLHATNTYGKAHHASLLAASRRLYACSEAVDRTNGVPFTGRVLAANRKGN
jgi:glycosyltransferase involved in cell wall biosynthesis